MHFLVGVVCGKPIAKREHRAGEFYNAGPDRDCHSGEGNLRTCASLFSAALLPASIIRAFSASACLNLIGKVSREIPVIASLQFGPLPIFAGKNATAIGRAAFAFHFITVVVGHAPIMG